jgi:FdrA protein
VVVSLCGTKGDPQGRDNQARMLNEAGGSVYLSNAAAAIEAARLATTRTSS